MTLMIREGRSLRVLVVGLGLSGRSSAQFLLKHKAQVVGVDRSQQILMTPDVLELCRNPQMKVMHEDAFREDITSFDLVVISPGVPSSQVHVQQAKLKGVEVIGEVELACRHLSKTSLAVTGTNGKTTVTLLVTHVLNSIGKSAVALGNIGKPLTSVIEDNEADVFVIELSSYQLETLGQKFIDAGVVLNITPDHLDRYSSMEEYAFAKANMQNCLKDRGVLFVEDRCLKEFKHLFKQSVLSYGYTKDCSMYVDHKNVYVGGEKALSLPQCYQGKKTHDVENLMAAYALCRSVGVTEEQFLSGFKTFQKPAHRIQFVREIHGVSYFDDSKGTNIDAVLCAVRAIEGTIVLIAGGVDKGAPYQPWIEGFEKRVKLICAIGQSASKIKKELGEHIPVKLFDSLESAVSYASSVADRGESVLLSPGCSSLDMFKDYAQRGEVFQRIVNAL